MKILIAGATGFIGRSVCRSLGSREHEILALSRSGALLPSNGNEFEGLRWIQSDLRLDAATIDVISIFEPEIVIDLAWGKIPDFSFATCLENLNNQLCFFSDILKMPSVKKIIVAGSCWEYNKSMGECSEADPHSSKDYFTWAKNSLHDFLTLECGKKEVILAWTRIFYVYGPFQRKESLIPTLVASLRENQVPGLRTPKNANDFIHVDDVACAIEKMTELDIPTGVYNLGSGKSVPVMDVCRIVERTLLGKEDMTRELETKTRETEKSIDFWAGIRSTKQLLNWAPQISLEEGIKDSVPSLIKAI